MHPVIFELMIKERIKDLTAELERARRIASARREKKKTAVGSPWKIQYRIKSKQPAE